MEVRMVKKSYVSYKLRIFQGKLRICDENTNIAPTKTAWKSVKSSFLPSLIELKLNFSH